MIRFVSLSLLAICGISSAFSEDTWTGFHAGVNVGYGRQEADWTDITYDWYGGTLSFNQDGVLAGLGGGYDHQFGSLVVGAVVDWNYTSFDETDGYGDNPADVKVTNSMDWMATLRARGGLAVDRTLLYLTFGLAMASVEHEFDSIYTADPRADLDISDEIFGTVYGIGLEHQFADHWSVNAELIQAVFPEKSEANGFNETYKVENKVAAFRLGANYRF